MAKNIYSTQALVHDLTGAQAYVRLSIDIDDVLDRVGRRAIQSKGGVGSALHGAITIERLTEPDHTPADKPYLPVPAIWIQSNHVTCARNGPFMARISCRQEQPDWRSLYTGDQVQRLLADERRKALMDAWKLCDDAGEISANSREGMMADQLADAILDLIDRKEPTT